MDTYKIQELANSIKSLQTGEFYLVNGWGIISFKSSINFVASKNAISFRNDTDKGLSHTLLIKELNEAIKPILNKYAEETKILIKEEIK